MTAVMDRPATIQLKTFATNLLTDASPDHSTDASSKMRGG
jgi:hypothetical protein